MASPQQTPDVFDQVSQPQSQPAQSTSAPATLSQPQQPASQGQGDVFDQISGGASVTTDTPTAQPVPVPDSLHIDPNASANKGILGTIEGNATNAAKATNAIGAGIGEGLLTTLNGGANLLHLPHATLEARQQELQQQNRENPTLNSIGNGAEGLAEFLMGDEALKGLALSDRLLKSAKIAKVLENSPLLSRAVQIGVNALRGGVTGGAVGTVKAADTNDLPTSLEKGAITGVATGAGTAALGALGTIPSIYRGLTAAPKIQAAFQTGVRDVLDNVASDAGVTPSPSTSIRDVAKSVGDAIQERSKAAYQALDAATGGRFQRFEDALRNVNDKLRETVGLNDDAEDALLEKKAEIEKSQQQTFDQAKANGVDPATVDKARADWKKAQSLYDLDRQIKMATSGLRPELAAPGAQNTAEVLDPSKAFLRLNRLYDSGRLQTAVGQDQAQTLMQHADNAFVQNARTLALKKGAKTVGKVIGYGAPTAVGIGLGAKELFDLNK